MTDYCLSEVQKGRYIFVCPDLGCSSIWEYFLVRHVARFDDKTRSKIEKHVTENYISLAKGYQQCPRCSTRCIPANNGDIRLQCPACSVGKTFEFCWACLREWTGTGVECCGNLGCNGKDPRFRILSLAEKKEIDGIPDCPSIRACPKCGLLISHKADCRHMTCTSCTAEFCFICLQPWRRPTTHIVNPCRIAPVQTKLGDPLWEQGNVDDEPQTPRTPENNNYRRCAIL